jgi:DNA-binding CsgD family transcriptional regulator
MKHTKRQHEVLTLIQLGLSNKLIARQLNIAESTVKVYVGDLMRLYGATNRGQLAVFSLQGRELMLPNLEVTPCGWLKKVNKRVESITFSTEQPDEEWEAFYLKA